ncbi:hypothetical protein PFICI_09775 [Pestalotiopsis fici W106-1]|uniref:Uncharacterized protein n=1 Tax=Pestalotiopsis fici (strain W106-1 / CGMCC3.15140) TaxID=1229662 RepID=W3WV20_PESFW|nr:uncharacterized protein PFICI_09775 [Pestalotiopsis fici W106-1]ETS77713.1 hypothetical protein PFICI_09775 [Pestalotiopsis fici W106-1]
MTATTHSEFNDQTEALEVANAFADSVRGKTVLVLGVNRLGLGFTTAEAFASQTPAHLIIASRTPSKIQECIDALEKEYPDVNYRLLQIDLSKQKSVRTAAAEVLSWDDIPTIDIVVQNGGTMGIEERTLTEEGIELHLATNHVGNFLFANLIMPKLIKAAERNPVPGATRVISVSSGSPQMSVMRWSDLTFETKNCDLPESEQPNYGFLKMAGCADPENQSYIPWEGYNQSKVANLLFAIGLSARVYDKHGILSVAVHPGVIVTELGRRIPPEGLAAVVEMEKAGLINRKNQQAGSSTSLVAALDPKLGKPEPKDGKENYGAMLSNCQIWDGVKPLASSSSEAEKLWKWSEEVVGEQFAY